MSDVIFPWEADMDNPEAIWADGCLSTREFAVLSKDKSDPLKVERARKITEHLVAKKHWAVCLCKTPYYMRTMYPLIAGAWIHTMCDTADIVDVSEIIDGVFSYGTEAKTDFTDTILETGLLIIPYIDPEHMGMKKAKGVISNLLMKRKLRGKPVVTEVCVTKKPTNTKEFASEVKRLKDVFGGSALSLFTDRKTKYFVVR
jgi:hypothetical protein